MKGIYSVALIGAALTSATLCLGQQKAGSRNYYHEESLGYEGIIQYGMIGTCTAKNPQFSGQQIRVPQQKLVGTGTTSHNAYRALNSACQKQIQDNCQGATLRLETKCRTEAKNGIYEIIARK